MKSGAPPPLVLVMMLVVTPAAFAVAGYFIYHYLHAVFALRTALEEKYKDVWERLGRPAVIRSGGGSKPPVPMISPVLPMLLWLWEAPQEGFDAETQELFDGARSYLVLGGGAMLVLAGLLPLLMLLDSR